MEMNTGNRFRYHQILREPSNSELDLERFNFRVLENLPQECCAQGDVRFCGPVVSCNIFSADCRPYAPMNFRRMPDVHVRSRAPSTTEVRCRK